MRLNGRMTVNNELEIMWNKKDVAHHEKVFRRRLSGMTKHLSKYLNQTLPEYEAVVNIHPQTLLYTTENIQNTGHFITRNHQAHAKI